MLEDDFTYVFRKALTGHQLAPADAAARAGLETDQLEAFAQGEFCAETARKLAPVLGLRAEAFANHATYHPQPLTLAGVERLDLSFGSEQVNAWLVRAGEVAVLFDAGYRADELLQEVMTRCGRLPDRVFITHAHPDHVGALAELLQAGLPVHAAGITGTLAMHPGEVVTCGPLTIHACDLAGHADPAMGFYIAGLAEQVLVTGDALFAGSIGGCSSPTTYQLALQRLRVALNPLPDCTVLLPGHGPATTLGEERRGNPFLA